jgi:class 3 adenylate cyclase
MAQYKSRRSKSRGKELRKLAAIMFTDVVGFDSFKPEVEQGFMNK